MKLLRDLVFPLRLAAHCSPLSMTGSPHRIRKAGEVVLRFLHQVSEYLPCLLHRDEGLCPWMDMPPAYLSFYSPQMKAQQSTAQDEVLAPPPSFTGLACLFVEGHAGPYSPPQTPNFGVPFEMQEEDFAAAFDPQRQQQPQPQTSFYVAKQELSSPPYQTPVCLSNEMQLPRSNESVIFYLQRDPHPAANNFYPSPPRRPEHEQPAHTSASYGRLNDRHERTFHETIQYRRSSYVIPITKKKKKKKTSRHQRVDRQNLQSWVEDCKAFAPAQKLVGNKASLDVGGGLRYARPRRNKQNQAGCSHCTSPY